MNNSPTLLCLTGFLGSGKTTVSNMFGKYRDVEVLHNIDESKSLKLSNKKLVVFDSMKMMDERTYLKWMIHPSNIIIVNVECPTETRLARIKERDSIGDMEFHLRDKQDKKSIYDISSMSKYNIHNGRSLEETSGQVWYLYSLLTKDPKQDLLLNNLTNQGR